MKNSHLGLLERRRCVDVLLYDKLKGVSGITYVGAINGAVLIALSEKEERVARKTPTKAEILHSV